MSRPAEITGPPLERFRDAFASVSFLNNMGVYFLSRGNHTHAIEVFRDSLDGLKGFVVTHCPTDSRLNTSASEKFRQLVIKANNRHAQQMKANEDDDSERKDLLPSVEVVTYDTCPQVAHRLLTGNQANSILPVFRVEDSFSIFSSEDLGPDDNQSVLMTAIVTHNFACAIRYRWHVMQRDRQEHATEGILTNQQHIGVPSLACQLLLGRTSLLRSIAPLDHVSSNHATPIQYCHGNISLLAFSILVLVNYSGMVNEVYGERPTLSDLSLMMDNMGLMVQAFLATYSLLEHNCVSSATAA